MGTSLASLSLVLYNRPLPTGERRLYNIHDTALMKQSVLVGFLCQILKTCDRPRFLMNKNLPTIVHRPLILCF